ncbi:hypothetical protein [Nocardia aobensis]|uniref:hypothetical protein n=1 Tax=Nocardia aobensis TaxID=257277 RepID=UPI0002EEF728|nr:hypothetical protein [Nocardia aobensis]
MVPTGMTVEAAHRIMQQHAHWSGAPCARRAAALRHLVALGRYVLDSRRCRVRVRFSHSDVAVDYQCPREIAEAFAARMRRRSDSLVVIDDQVHPDLPPLPCARLWMP